MARQFKREDRSGPIEWASRLAPGLLRRLYLLDAKGIQDESVLDEVGMTLLVRCEDIRRVSERRCWRCGGELEGEKAVLFKATRALEAQSTGADVQDSARSEVVAFHALRAAELAYSGVERNLVANRRAGIPGLAGIFARKRASSAGAHPYSRCDVASTTLTWGHSREPKRC